MPNNLLSWTAIWAGAITGVGLNFLLNLLALVIGLSSFILSSGGQTQFFFPGFLGFCLAGFTAMFVTGWVAGRLTPRLHAVGWGILIGFIAWSMLLMFTIVLITNMIQYASFHSNFTSNLVEIKLRNNSPMLTGTLVDFSTNPPLNVQIESFKKLIVLNAFLTFVLFLIGALASCLGGLLGYFQSKPYRIK